MNELAVALGLLLAPSLGASIADTFRALGPDAVFGPGCGDGNGALTIQAPARLTRPTSTALSGAEASRLTLMAQFSGGRVTSVHLALPTATRTSALTCHQSLVAYGIGPISVHEEGGTTIYERAAQRIATSPAKYRALYRPLREDCRVMLTVGQN